MTAIKWDLLRLCKFALANVASLCFDPQNRTVARTIAPICYPKCFIQTVPYPGESPKTFYHYSHSSTNHCRGGSHCVRAMVDLKRRRRDTTSANYETKLTHHEASLEVLLFPNTRIQGTPTMSILTNSYMNLQIPGICNV